MSHRLWPRKGIHLAVVGDDMVVLDIEADAYGCLPDAGKVVRMADDGGLAIDNPAAARDLEAAGLVEASRTGPGPRRLIPPTHEIAAALGTPRPTAVALCLTHLGASTVAFRGKHLAQLVAAANTRVRPAPGADAAGVLATYRAALPWAPFEGECLQRSFLLKRLLASRGIASDWVFGVRTWPFAAHCWIQIGDGVAGDSLERVANYTPIMAV